MCAIDESSEHNISVWDWQKGEKGQKLAENKVSRFARVALSFLIILEGWNFMILRVMIMLVLTWEF